MTSQAILTTMSSDSMEENSPQVNVISKNNECVSLFNSGHRSLAVFSLVKSLNTVPIVNSDIIYNLAVMHLFTNNFGESIKLFKSLVPIYPKNPRLWFRLSECCIQESNSNFFLDLNVIKRKHFIFDGYIGQGIHRKMILKDIADMKLTEEEMSKFKFSRSCLLNCLSLLSSEAVSFAPSSNPSESELVKFKIAVYLSLAYTSLRLDDYTLGYRYAKCALELQPKGYQKALANLYAGHALILLDKVTDAMNHFSPSHNYDDSFQLPAYPCAATTMAFSSSNSPTESPPPYAPGYLTTWFPTTAKLVMCYNFAVTYVLRGDLTKATELLRQIGSSVPPAETLFPVQVVLLATYIQLKQGSISVARSLVRQNLPSYS